MNSNLLSVVSMKNLLSTKIFALLLLLAGTFACKSTEQATTQTASNENERSEEQLEELYWSKVDSARMASFTEADVKFMTGMIAHHAQALVMSQLAPENGASSQIQTLASRIINAQKDEIKTMQQWLRDRKQPVVNYDIDGINLTITIEGKEWKDYRKMRGVLSQQQLKQLSQAKGKKFDRLFLKQMIEHHAGAVHMVDNLFEKDGAAQDNESYQLASSIQVDQKTEIERMRMMLDDITSGS
ncbi:MAG: DUF305 domain-containing protein [Fodinibius sp.]|nr:DUF305 domain-containing protein [Fodinibius sp.]